MNTVGMIKEDHMENGPKIIAGFQPWAECCCRQPPARTSETESSRREQEKLGHSSPLQSKMTQVMTHTIQFGEEMTTADPKSLKLLLDFS